MNLSDIAFDDDVRRHVPATEISYDDGTLLLTFNGVIALCDAVISGRARGDKEKAEKFRAYMKEKFNR